MSGLKERLQSWERVSTPHSSVVAVRVNGELMLREILEGIDLRIGTAVPSRLRFPIYSITKTMTAVCALLLHESGLLDLDERVTHWFPDLPLHRSMTVTHLLRHSGGIPDYGPVPEYHDAVCTNPYSPWTTEERDLLADEAGTLLRDFFRSRR